MTRDGQGVQQPDPRPEVRFGQLLRAARDETGLSLRALAGRQDFPWSVTSISDYENGRRLATQQYVAAFEKCVGVRSGALENERVIARDERRALDDGARERSGPAVSDQTDATSSTGSGHQLGADGDPRRARTARWAVTPVACVSAGLLVLAFAELRHDDAALPRPAGRADATRLVEQYIARFRAEDLGGHRDARPQSTHHRPYTDGVDGQDDDHSRTRRRPRRVPRDVRPR